MAYFKLAVASLCIFLGLLIFLVAFFGLKKFKHPLNRLHAAALGDTLGLLLVMLGVAIWRGFSFATLKIVAIILFFWFASPVSSHMLARFEVETDENLGEITLEEK